MLGPPKNMWLKLVLIGKSLVLAIRLPDWVKSRSSSGPAPPMPSQLAFVVQLLLLPEPPDHVFCARGASPAAAALVATPATSRYCPAITAPSVAKITVNILIVLKFVLFISILLSP